MPHFNFDIYWCKQPETYGMEKTVCSSLQNRIICNFQTYKRRGCHDLIQFSSNCLNCAVKLSKIIENENVSFNFCCVCGARTAIEHGKWFSAVQILWNKNSIFPYFIIFRPMPLRRFSTVLARWWWCHRRLCHHLVRLI